jgi:predicted AAA+ superfamily ATPase
MEKAILKFEARHRALLAATPTTFERYLIDEIKWDSTALLAVVGPRGVGKTTLLAQRLLHLGLSPAEALYIDLGDIAFHSVRLIDLAEDFLERGGKYLFLDEVHRYAHSSWAEEVKTLHDFYRDRLRVVLSGSSILQILEASADLSRRVHFYHLPGLSFREYLSFKVGVPLSSYTLADLVEHQLQIQRDIFDRHSFEPVPHFETYLQRGYYAFVIEEDHGYVDQLNQIVQLVLGQDIAYATGGRHPDVRKLTRLLQAVASSVPFKPNVSKLASRVELTRNTVIEYLNLLERANILQLLSAEGKGISVLSKPDKIYLDNTNLIYALSPQRAEIGAVRETFFLNQLASLRRRKLAFPPEVTLPKRGDFHYRYQGAAYTFEIGGPNKTADQIGRAPGSYTVVDAKATATEHRIPLWLFGLLY